MTDSPGARAYRVAADPQVRVVIANIGLACCSLEVDAAVLTGQLLPEEPQDCASARTVLLVSGTVTDVLAPAVIRLRDSLPQPVEVVSFGACASTGGPYWDAPSVTKGIDQLTAVHAFVPGCPPRPEALVAGLLSLGQDRG